MDATLDFLLALEILENELYKAVLGTSASAAQNHCEKIVKGAGGLKKKIDANLTELQEHVQRLADAASA